MILLLLVFSIFIVFSSSAPTSSDAELQIRLALCCGGSGVSVTWTTKDNSTVPLVKFGTSPSSLVYSSVDSSQSTYGYSWYSTVLLTALSPSTTYYYLITNPHTQQPVSHVHSFVSSPVSSPTQSLSVALIGDLGVNFNNLTSPSKVFKSYNHGAAQTMKLAHQLASQVDFFYHLGDISYADDVLLQPFHTYEEIWDSWGIQMANITQEKLYFSLPGNHEVKH
jgi:hypothetical protein